MKFTQKFMIVLFAVLAFNRDVSACDKYETFWANTSMTAMQKIANNSYPTVPNLDAFITATGDNPAASFGLINVSALGEVSSGVINDDLQTIIDYMRTGSASLGQATADIFGLINKPVIPPAGPSLNILYDDLQFAIAAINAQGTLGAAINQEFTHIGTGSLPGPIGPIASVNVLGTDIDAIIAQMNPGSLSLGAAVTANINAIDVPGLIGGPPSSGIVSADINMIIAQMSPASISLGSAVKANLTAINVNGLPGGPPPANVVSTDLATIKAAINPASADVGSAVTSVSNLIDPTAASLNAGITGVNTVLGNAIAAADAKGKADAILTALDTLTPAQAAAIVAGPLPHADVSIQAWLAFFGIPV